MDTTTRERIEQLLRAGKTVYYIRMHFGIEGIDTPLEEIQEIQQSI